MDGVDIIDRLGLSFCTLYEMRTLIAGVWLLPYGGPATTACKTRVVERQDVRELGNTLDVIPTKMSEVY